MNPTARKRVTALIMITVLLMLSLASVAVAAPNVDAPGSGPALNSGDCIPDGSGLDSPFGVGAGRGPAPNSGDGIPDGSGF
jgi:hypothetical protein